MKPRNLTFAPLIPLLTLGGGAIAEERSLECRLYMAEATEESSAYEAESAGRMLGTFRRSSVCVFADGSVADKQFVNAYSAAADGASGTDHGFSVYTFEDGDTLTLAYGGGWDEDGYRSEYEVLAGTGAYEGASGTGTITGVQSPWTGTSIVDVTIDVTMPDS